MKIIKTDFLFGILLMSFSCLLLALHLLDIVLQTSMEILNLVLLNIIVIVVQLINISCIIIYIL